MDKFNLKQYLSEGKLLKENISDIDKIIELIDKADIWDELYLISPDLENEYGPSTPEDKEELAQKIYSIFSNTPNGEFSIMNLEDTIEMNLNEGKLVKENSDEYIEDQNAGYLIDQIADDMMYTEFESKEDIDKFLDSIISGIEKLRKQQYEIWDDVNRDPEDDFGDEELEEGRHYYGARMDDEWEDSPRSWRRGSSSYKRALENPPTPSGNQPEDEWRDEEEDIEFVKGKDYNAQNQKVLRNMRESKLDKALKIASSRLEENKKKK